MLLCRIARLSRDIFDDAEVPGWRTFISYSKEDKETPQEEKNGHCDNDEPASPVRLTYLL